MVAHSCNNPANSDFTTIYGPGMAKVSDSRGSRYKENNLVPEAARNRIQQPWPLNPVKSSRKWPDLAEISILASL